MLVTYDNKIIGWWSVPVWGEQLMLYHKDSTALQGFPANAGSMVATEQVSGRIVRKSRLKRSIRFDIEMIYRSRVMYDDCIAYLIHGLKTDNVERQRVAALDLIQKLAPEQRELQIMLQGPCRPDILYVSEEYAFGLNVHCDALVAETLDMAELLFLQHQFCPIDPESFDVSELTQAASPASQALRIDDSRRWGERPSFS